LLAVLIRDRDFQVIGAQKPDRAQAMADLAGFLVLILPVFLLAWWALFRFGFKARFQFHFPLNPAGLVMWQFLGVALPEEVFFRGWLQGRLNQLLGRAWPIPGAMIGPGLLISALAFALAHLLVKPDPVRLLVFFPALLFGYFREREGSVLVPVIAHALGNISLLVLQAGAGA
jgi:membrane protease YdiL (CAAX protease family)